MNTARPAALAAIAALTAAAALAAHSAFLIGPLLHLRALIAGSIPILAFWGPARDLLGRVPGWDRLEPPERFVFASFMALALAAAAAFAMLTLRIAHPAAIYAMAAVSLFAYLRKLGPWLGECVRGWLPEDAGPGAWTVLGASLFVLLAAALVPPLGYDAHEYHLAVPAEYLRQWGWTAFPLNVYAYFPMNVELLYMFPLAADAAAGCTVVNLWMALLAALAAMRLARRAGAGRVSILPPLLFLASGLTARLVVQANIDLGLALSAAVLLLGYETARQDRNRVAVVAMGAALGFGLGSKYIALLSLLFPFLAVAAADGLAFGRRDMLRPAAYAVGLGMLLWAPWLVRNLALSGNPAYPLFNNVFEGSPRFYEDMFQAAHAPPDASFPEHAADFFALVWTKCVDESLPFGFPAWWLLGLPMLFVRGRGAGMGRMGLFMLAAYAAWLFMTQRNDRFMAAALPAMAVFPCLALERVPREAWRKALSAGLTAFAGFCVWTQAAALLRDHNADYLTSPVFDEQFFSRHLPHYRAIDWLNNRPGPVNAVFIGEAQTYGAEFAHTAPTVFNPHPLMLGLDPSVTHILFNGHELNRLRIGYGPLGWERQGAFLHRWMEENRAALVPVYDALPDDPGTIAVYAVRR